MNFSLTLVQIGNGGLLLVLTQYLQFVLGYSPTQAGLAFIPLAVASLACNTLGATLGQKVGNRAMITAGLAVMAAGFALLAGVSPDDGLAGFSVALLVLGAGGGLAMPAAIAALMGEVPPEQAGVGSALNDTIQQAGAALGVAILGSVVSSVFTGSMPLRAGNSIGDALAVAEQTRDAGLATAARESFTSAMSVSFAVAAAGVLFAAALAFAVLRKPSVSVSI